MPISTCMTSLDFNVVCKGIFHVQLIMFQLVVEIQVIPGM